MDRVHIAGFALGLRGRADLGLSDGVADAAGLAFDAAPLPLPLPALAGGGSVFAGWLLLALRGDLSFWHALTRGLLTRWLSGWLPLGLRGLPGRLRARTVLIWRPSLGHLRGLLGALGL